LNPRKADDRGKYERTGSIGPAGVVATACWQRGPDATQEAPANQHCRHFHRPIADDLQPEQYAYRRDRSALDAVRHVHRLINTGHGEIVEADLSSYFRFAPLSRESREGDLLAAEPQKHSRLNIQQGTEQRVWSACSQMRWSSCPSFIRLTTRTDLPKRGCQR
jgi:hypothetical protein